MEKISEEEWIDILSSTVGNIELTRDESHELASLLNGLFEIKKELLIGGHLDKF